jgi:hypothetical protein
MYTINLTHYEVKQLLFALGSNILELKKVGNGDSVFQMLIDDRYKLAEKIETTTNIKTYGANSIETTKG